VQSAESWGGARHHPAASSISPPLTNNTLAIGCLTFAAAMLADEK
jgi:hypothetical protein